MKPASFFAPKGVLDKKPPHGAPCTSCGLCCMATLCPLAQTVFGHNQGPCPALKMQDGKSTCGMVTDPLQFARSKVFEHGVEKTRDAALLLIGSGLGCDARVNGEATNYVFYATLREWDRKMRSQVAQARKLWGLL